MNILYTSLLLCTLSFASMDTIESFKADFTQSVTDDKNATLLYNGHLLAQKPQNAVWHYTSPIKKVVYMDEFRVSIVEPEIEQVIIRKIQSNLDFFHMIKNAKKLDDTIYEANYKKTTFLIIIKKSLIESISYKDAFENDVKIVFKNQKQNLKIKEEEFIADYPLEYDVIRD